MAKKTKIIDARQMNLFDIIEQLNKEEETTSKINATLGSLSVEDSIRDLTSASLKQSSLDRFGVAAQMSRTSGREITKSQLDSWTAESKEHHRFPLDILPAFIEATGDKTILHLLCEKVGCRCVEDGENSFMTLGKIKALQIELNKLEKQVKEKLNL